jgi:hypothetical protein
MREEARMYRVFNRDTDKEISRVIWANDESGRYRQHLFDEHGNYIIENDTVKSKIFTGNIELRMKT